MIDVNKGILTLSKLRDGDEYFYVKGRKSNFKVKEFACKDGSDEIKVDSELIEKLQSLREFFNRPIVVNSGYRTVDYNRKVGGVSASQHVLGKAADIIVKNTYPSTVAKVAKDFGFTGVGTYKDFVHVDVREHKSYWNG